MFVDKSIMFHIYIYIYIYIYDKKKQRSYYKDLQL